MTNEMNKLLRLAMFCTCAYLILQYSGNNNILTHVTLLTIVFIIIDTYFPNNVIKLTGNIEHDMKLLYDICINPNRYKNQINIVEIERKVSLLHNIEYLYNSSGQ